VHFRIRKTAIILCTAVLLLPVGMSFGETLPTAVAIDVLARSAREIVDGFMAKSFDLRMGYEFDGGFVGGGDREKLSGLARAASSELEDIAERQKKLKRQIEDYEGADWESRYGATGLWRKASAGVYATLLGGCEIDFYAALTILGRAREPVLRRILARLDVLVQLRDTAHVHLLRIKVLALSARMDSAYLESARKIFDSFSQRSDVSESIALRLELERIKMFGVAGPGQLESLGRRIAESKSAGDRELVLSFAFLQRRLSPGLFEGTLAKWPDIEQTLGSLLLANLSRRSGGRRLEKLAVFEAELAVQSAWRSDASEHNTLLEDLMKVERFETPLIFYVSAVSVAGDQPGRVVGLLMKASRLQHAGRSERLGIGADEIARQAARLAYSSLGRGPEHCELVLGAFANYVEIAARDIDEESEYLYSGVLSSCGQTERARKLLREIAYRSSGRLRNRARLDLVIMAMEAREHENESGRERLLRDLAIILRASESGAKLRTEAAGIYCGLLGELKDEGEALEVVGLLSGIDIMGETNLSVCKSKAFQRLGRLDKSARCLLTAIASGGCESAAEAVELLREVTERIEQFEGQAVLLDDCRKLAEFCYGCLDGRARGAAGLFLVETSVLSGKSSKKLSELERIVEDVGKEGMAGELDLTRCRARVLAEGGRFGEAAGLWARVGANRLSESTGAGDRSWKWWRAKYNELYCWARIEGTKSKDVLHTIEVLENSISDIPTLWAEKFGGMKEQLQSGLLLAVGK